MPPDIKQGPTKTEHEAAEDVEEEPEEPDVDQSEVDKLISEFRVRIRHFMINRKPAQTCDCGADRICVRYQRS